MSREDVQGTEPSGLEYERRLPIPRVQRKPFDIHRFIAKVYMVGGALVVLVVVVALLWVLLVGAFFLGSFDMSGLR